MTETFKCSMCGETFETAWSDEEAIEELSEVFPGYSTKECNIVCDDCYKKLGLG